MIMKIHLFDQVPELYFVFANHLCGPTKDCQYLGIFDDLIQKAALTVCVSVVSFKR